MATEKDLRRCRELEEQISALTEDVDLHRLADRASVLELTLKLRLVPSEAERDRMRQQNMDLLDRLGVKKP